MSRHHLCPKCNARLVPKDINTINPSDFNRIELIYYKLFKIVHRCRCGKKNRFMLFMFPAPDKITPCLNHYTHKIVELITKSIQLNSKNISHTDQLIL